MQETPIPPTQNHPWRRRLFIGLGAILLVLVIACTAVSIPLYRRALSDVDRYLDGPKAGGAGVVLSAPQVLDVGRPNTKDGLISDLARAQFTEMEVLTGPDQYRILPDGLEIWAEAARTLDGALPEVRTTVTFNGSRISAVDGGPHRLRPTVLSTLGDLESARTYVDLSTLSPHVVPALLAMEDSRFYDHPGVDVRGTARAFKSTVFDDDLQGGSTLTQQLAKNLFLEPDRTFKRKIREVFFALAIERRLRKDEILEMYLNELYFGHVGGRPVYGIEQAARGFYGVPSSELALGQAATLAGIISSPNPYNPVRHPLKARERRNLVLGRMVALGTLDEPRGLVERDRNIEVNPELPLAGRRVPWVVDAAVERMSEELSDDFDDVTIHSWIEMDLQRAAENAVAKGYAELVAGRGSHANAQLALVAVRPSDGAVVALVGGRDWAESPFDRASNGHRQIGSLVKPLTMLAAMETDAGITPATILIDAPITRGTPRTPWIPRNYDGRYWGALSLRSAIENSRNIPAVLLSERVGIPQLQRFLQRAGLEDATAFPSVALGAFSATPLQMAGAYTAFPNGGVVRQPQVLRQVDTPRREADWTWDAPQDALAGEVASVMATHVMQGVIGSGTGQRARSLGVDGPVGGKTGTTDDYKDAWFVGFSPDLVVAVWVGTDEGEGLGLAGSQGALPTWAYFMAAVGPSSHEFPTSSRLVTVDLCTESHGVARAECPSTYGEIVPRSHHISICERHDPMSMWYWAQSNASGDPNFSSSDDAHTFYAPGRRPDPDANATEGESVAETPTSDWANDPGAVRAPPQRKPSSESEVSDEAEPPMTAATFDEQMGEVPDDEPVPTEKDRARRRRPAPATPSEDTGKPEIIIHR